MRPPAWLVGLAVAVATLLVLTQIALMAIGIVSLLLIPALSIWARVGVTALLDRRRSLSVGDTLVIAGAVVALFAALVMVL